MRDDAGVGISASQALALSLKVGLAACAQHQRGAGCCELLGDLGAESETCTGNDRVASRKCHATRPTEIIERRASPPSVASRKRPASITIRPFMARAASS